MYFGSLFFRITQVHVQVHGLMARHCPSGFSGRVVMRYRPSRSSLGVVLASFMMTQLSHRFGEFW